MTTPTTTAAAPPVGVRRLLAAPTPARADHERTHGPAPVVGPGIVEELGLAGVDGRGGAGFPLARKLAAANRPGRRPPIVIANAAEGEPASRKDAVLLARAPHLVLDGLVVAALAVGATEAVVAVGAAGGHATDPAAAGHATGAGHAVAPTAAWPSTAEVLHRALAERHDPVAIRVRSLPHTSFVSGEAGALASAVAGGPGRPGDRVVRLSERGPSGRPTVVSNVETLANAALVARYGAAWNRSIGSASAPGTRLVTVSDVRDPATAVVLEVAGGTVLGEVIRASRAVPDPTRTRAVLVGGWGGTWVPTAALAAGFDPDGLAPWGAAPGAGVLAVLDDRTCPVGVTARIAGALAGASAGRCGPCVNGLPRIADVLGVLAAGGRGGDLAGEVRRIAALVDGRGACHHPDGVARMVRSALGVFHDDVQAHLGGYCSVPGARP